MMSLRRVVSLRACRAVSARPRRATTLLIAAVLALGAAAAGCVPDGPMAAGTAGPPDPITATIYHRTNADRGAHGLAALTWDGQLHGLAAEWAGYLADSRRFHHRDLRSVLDAPGWESYWSLGENILVGPSGIDGHQMQDAWLRSPSHHANIMGDYDSIGIAIAYGGDGYVRAVENFGRH